MLSLHRKKGKIIKTLNIEVAHAPQVPYIQVQCIILLGDALRMSEGAPTKIMCSYTLYTAYEVTVADSVNTMKNVTIINN